MAPIHTALNGCHTSYHLQPASLYAAAGILIGFMDAIVMRVPRGYKASLLKLELRDGCGCLDNPLIISTSRVVWRSRGVYKTA